MTNMEDEEKDTPTAAGCARSPSAKSALDRSGGAAAIPAARIFRSVDNAVDASRRRIRTDTRPSPGLGARLDPFARARASRKARMHQETPLCQNRLHLSRLFCHCSFSFAPFFPAIPTAVRVRDPPRASRLPNPSSLLFDACSSRLCLIGKTREEVGVSMLRAGSGPAQGQDENMASATATTLRSKQPAQQSEKAGAAKRRCVSRRCCGARVAKGVSLLTNPPDPPPPPHRRAPRKRQGPRRHRQHRRRTFRPDARQGQGEPGFERGARAKGTKQFSPTREQPGEREGRASSNKRARAYA